MKRIFAILGIALAIASINSCKDVDETFIETAGVSLAKSTLSIYPGDFVALESKLTPDNASSTYRTWSSSNTAVATVDSWGRVYGVAPGDATITVTTASGGHTASCKVTVVPIAETEVTLSAEELTVYYDEYETLTATVGPVNASYKTVTWTSADPEVASIDQTGKIKGENLGTTTITATTHGGLTAVCNVTVAVRMPTSAETVELWKSDRAGFRGLYGAAADEGKSAGKDGWLKFEKGAATWAANTTGKVRTATLELSTGSKITVTQLEDVDFKGSYTFNAKFFSNNTKWTTAGNSKTLTVTFGDPILGETLTDVDGKEHVNALGVTGLYFTAVMDAAVDIDYENKTVKLGLFLDARDNAQAVENGVSGYGYACFLPEMGTGTGSSWASPWNFVQPDLGADKDYCWLWFDLNEDMTQFSWNSYSQAQFMKSDKATSANRIIGITCAVSKTAKVDADNVNPTYNVIYQANVNNTSTTPVTFTKN